ncbi:N-acetylmuramoyl-L-alanine amidase, partial [Oceanobacillus sp. E9]|uniref:N-acetylmuramoyl-L-alanine amidase n=2 Tax=Oceanobacillus TaxID=182709 RepID=UPI001969D58A
VNGIADEITWLKLDETYYKVGFQLGDRHDDIIKIKQQLNAIGFGGISETNYFGEWMETRVQQFQRYYGLSVTGQADQQTQQKISSVYNSPFQNGKRHDGTVELKEKLNHIGFGYITVSTLFGSFTETQVRKFQDYYGLRVNGIADEVTIDKINEIYSSPLQKGKSDSRVIEIKEMLNALGYDGIAISEYFGSWTETRLKQFQSDYNLPVSGIADPKTIQKLDDSLIRVFLDPGHGGHDPGGQGYGINEKDVVLDIALQTEQFLSTKYKGVLVNMSRTDDTFIELTERANMANRWGADYFVSFHTNAFNGSANGFETYIHNGNVSNETKQRQTDIHSYIINNINVNDRGEKTANFNVLRNTNMSSILLEYMFIDNFVENTLLKDPSYRTYLAQITADAIASSYNLKRR